MNRRSEGVMYEHDVEEKGIKMKHAAPLTAFQKKLFNIVKGAYDNDRAEKAYTKVNEDRHYHLIQDLEKDEEILEQDTKEDDRQSPMQREKEEMSIEVNIGKRSNLMMLQKMQWIFPFGMLFNIVWIHLLSNSFAVEKESKMLLSSMEVLLVLLLIGTYAYQIVWKMEQRLKTYHKEEADGGS